MNKQSTPIEVKFAGDTGIIEGYASTFGPPADRAGDVVMPGAFGDQTFTVPLLAYHDSTQPVGSATLTPDSYGLKMIATLANTGKAQEMRELVKAGAVPALSFGYKVDASTPNDQGGEDLYKVDLMEVSLVPIPCNPRALVTGAKAFGVEPDIKALAAEIVKAGARHSAADQEAIQEAHDQLVKAGASCDMGKSLDLTFELELAEAELDSL